MKELILSLAAALTVCVAGYARAEDVAEAIVAGPWFPTIVLWPEKSEVRIIPSLVQFDSKRRLAESKSYLAAQRIILDLPNRRWQIDRATHLDVLDELPGTPKH